ncbi:hypothetical protein RDV89_19620 [Nocardioides zeae]|uniref:Uncharacterized protein n=1 Tax=Nocardioides imazamoxiresistens TaxID=3231893 RepID=A0ABU3Q1I1_9ACTN|nr:hypothetical protein [Nocardioides zeae]MDT9595306.1 hypothetical protein [Nocardioides zeae]
MVAVVAGRVRSILGLERSLLRAVAAVGAGAYVALPLVGDAVAAILDAPLLVVLVLAWWAIGRTAPQRPGARWERAALAAGGLLGVLVLLSVSLGLVASGLGPLVVLPAVSAVGLVFALLGADERSAQRPPQRPAQLPQ